MNHGRIVTLNLSSNYGLAVRLNEATVRIGGGEQRVNYVVLVAAFYNGISWGLCQASTLPVAHIVASPIFKLPRDLPQEPHKASRVRVWVVDGNVVVVRANHSIEGSSVFLNCHRYIPELA